METRLNDYLEKQNFPKNEKNEFTYLGSNFVIDKDLLLSFSEHCNSGLLRQNKELLECLKDIIHAQFSPTSTLANLNGTISKAQSLIQKIEREVQP